jgi:SAM-dependent MidA family methyltransferase
MLPSMTTEEASHSSSVVKAIRERIEAAGGWVPFDVFMELALYAPGLGYYTAGGTKIGRGGDFTTAPEVSDLFSQCVARQCAEVLGSGGGSVLELGAGTGRMAAVVLATLGSLGALPERYFILEVSADLRERQRERIGHLPAELRERVVWLDALPARALRGVILANEVLDALPCQRVVIRDGEARALGVAAGAGRRGGEEAGAAADFVEREGPADAAVIEAWRAISDGLPFELGGQRADTEVSRGGRDGTAVNARVGEGGRAGTEGDAYRTEVCTRMEPWIASLSDCLESGLVLLFDYGLPRAHYYHPQRTNGTLRCHFKQRAHDDPFINVGVQDITAWVDFTRVAEAADAAGLQVSGFATQAAFLLGLGIEGMVSDVRLASEARQLLMPGEMGEAFKAMALTRGFDAPLSGFSVQDLRHSL